MATAESARSTLGATTAAAPAHARRDFAGIAAAALQFAILLLIMKRFAIEGGAFFVVALIAGGGFLVHALLPRAAKLPFFALLSIATILVTLGPVQGAWLLAIGLETKPDDVALISLERTWTWRQLEAASSQLAANYLALGLKPGDRVASLMPNRGARLGNFAVTEVSPDETWVTDAEWMQPQGVEKYGADGSVWVSRIRWSRPNRQVE